MDLSRKQLEFGEAFLGVSYIKGNGSICTFGAFEGEGKIDDVIGGSDNLLHKSFTAWDEYVTLVN